MRYLLHILLPLLLLIGHNANAQDKGFIFLIGPSVTLHGGSTDEDFDYTNERLSWQFNGQFGHIFTRGESIRGNMLGVFASYGNTNPQMIALLQEGGAELTGTLDTDKKFNEFYTLEAGMTIAQFLRLSGGIGRQAYSYDNNQRTTLKYFSATLGVSFNLGTINWVIDTNLMAGKDLNQNVLRMSTGFLVKF